MIWFVIGIITSWVVSSIFDYNGQALKKSLTTMNVGDVAEVRKGSDGLILIEVRRLTDVEGA